MAEFWKLTDNPQPFNTFGTPHLVVLGIILGVIILVYVFKNRLREPEINKNLRYTMAAILAVQQLSYYIWHLHNGTYDLTTALPLNVCGASIFMSIYLLLTGSYRVYEVVFFWGLAGTFQALLTPDMQGYNYPHYRFFQFFIGHGFIIITVLFMTFVNRYRPKLFSIYKSFFVANLFAVFVLFFNIRTGANYMFLLHKPTSASLLDFMGPWPWYILYLDVIAIFFFFLCYLPVAIEKVFKGKVSNEWLEIKM